MSNSVVGLQMWTLRDFCKTPADVAATLKRVRQIGYELVELAGLCGMEPSELRKVLDGEGLSCVSAHVGWEQMRDQPERLAEEYKTLGCELVAVGIIPGDMRNEKGYRQFAKEASVAARGLKERGLAWAYHNHSFEFEHFGKKTGMHFLATESERDVFHFEIDTYWVQHGGGDPAAWLRALKGRAPIVHLKDMTIAKTDKGLGPVMAEVGEGNLFWKNILDACREAGVKRYVVEQDICQRDPFESIRISLENLRAMGLR